jgi:membrane-bound serine protease (ClpP class)
VKLASYFFLILGFLLILIEFFLPSWLIGIIGSVFLVLSIVFFAMHTNSLLAICLYVMGVFLLLSLFIYLMIKGIRKGKFKGIYLNQAQDGYVASEFEKELIGKEGVALTDLKPSGHILVAERRYQAISKAGYVEKGTKIKVIDGAGAHLIVKRMEG